MKPIDFFKIRRKKKLIKFLLVCGLLLLLKKCHSSSWNLLAPLKLYICEDMQPQHHSQPAPRTSTTLTTPRRSTKLTPLSILAKPLLPTSVPVNFQLILPYIEPTLKQKESGLFMAVIVNSAAGREKNRKLRETIRKTWGNWKRPWKIKETWRVFFVLGVSENKTAHEANLKEAQKHNDIIIGNITDNYRNVVVKTFMGLFYTATKLSCRYVLKTNDDVYVRVPGLINWLVDAGNPRSFYGGYISKFHAVPRNPTSKWYISYEQYNKPNWPPWCHGSYTVFSYDVIPFYLTYTYRDTPYHTDDAYIGVASKYWGIKARYIPGFTIDHFSGTDRVRSDAQLLKALAIGHDLKPDVMIKYYRFYQRNHLE